MSALENSRSKAQLGMQYTPFREYLAKLVRHYSKLLPQPVEEYSRRKDELALAKAFVS